MNVQLGEEHSHPEPFRDPTRQEIVTYLRRLVALPNAHRPRVSDKLKAIEIVNNMYGFNKTPEGGAPIHLNLHVELQTVIAKMRGSSHAPSMQHANPIAIDIATESNHKLEE